MLVLTSTLVCSIRNRSEEDIVMIYVLIGIPVIVGIWMFFSLRSPDKGKSSYSKIERGRRSNVAPQATTRATQSSSKNIVGGWIEELKSNFEIKVHKSETRTQRYDDSPHRSSYESQSPTNDGGEYLVGVAEQVRRLGGDPRRFSTWDEAVVYMRRLAGVEDIPPVYNLTRKIDQRMYRKIKKLGGEPQPDWSYFEAKVYISRLEQGLTSDFRPILLNRYGAKFVDWFYRKSGAWEADVCDLPKKDSSVIRFEVGRKYVQTEYPPLSSPYVVDCVGKSSSKVQLRFAPWVGEDDLVCKVSVKGGVEVVEGYRADHIIVERPFEEKEKLTHWVVDFSSMEEKKTTRSKNSKSKSSKSKTSSEQSVL